MASYLYIGIYYVGTARGSSVNPQTNKELDLRAAAAASFLRFAAVCGAPSERCRHGKGVNWGERKFLHTDIYIYINEP